jgi:hypothetical protein
MRARRRSGQAQSCCTAGLFVNRQRPLQHSFALARLVSFLPGRTCGKPPLPGRLKKLAELRQPTLLQEDAEASEYRGSPARHSASAIPSPSDIRTKDHRDHFVLRMVSAHAFTPHPAIGGGDQPLRRDVEQFSP